MASASTCRATALYPHAAVRLKACRPTLLGCTYVYTYSPVAASLLVVSNRSAPAAGSHRNSPSRRHLEWHRPARTMNAAYDCCRPGSGVSWHLFLLEEACGPLHAYSGHEWHSLHCACSCRVMLPLALCSMHACACSGTGSAAGPCSCISPQLRAQLQSHTDQLQLHSTPHHPWLPSPITALCATAAARPPPEPAPW